MQPRKLKCEHKANGHAVVSGSGLAADGVIQLLVASGFRRIEGTKLQFSHFSTKQELIELEGRLHALGVDVERVEAEHP